MPSAEYLVGLDEIDGLRDGAPCAWPAGASPASHGGGDRVPAGGAASREPSEQGRAPRPASATRGHEGLPLQPLGRPPDGVHAWTWPAPSSTLSDLMMEGLDAREALEWMREHGFPMAGMNMRVMGAAGAHPRAARPGRLPLPAVRREPGHVRDAAAARRDPRPRAGGAAGAARLRVVAHERVPRAAARRGQRALSERIERMRDHAFEDEQAGDEFRELLDELDRLRPLEEFLRQRGDRFHGSESADYETAQELRERIEALEQLARNLQEGNFEPISPDELRELLGRPGRPVPRHAARPRVRAGEGGLPARRRRSGAHPARDPAIGANALADVYTRAAQGARRTARDPVARASACRVPTRRVPGRSATTSISTSCGR